VKLPTTKSIRGLGLSLKKLIKLKNEPNYRREHVKISKFDDDMVNGYRIMEFQKFQNKRKCMAG
jgi:hypothetical protein